MDKKQLKNILKVGAYVSVSGVLGYFIAVIADNPELFGVIAPIINLILVTAKQLIDNQIDNSDHL